MLLEHPWGIDIPITGVLSSYSQVSWLNRGLNGYVFWAVRLETSLAAAPPQPLVPPAFDLADLPFFRQLLESGGFEDETTDEENFRVGAGARARRDRRADRSAIARRPAPRSSPRPSSK